MRKGDLFLNNIYAYHHDPDQWIEHDKFIPERFDSDSRYFKRPNGEKRHPLTFCPFLGGKRACIGKTFAEVLVRYTIPLIYYHMDFEFYDPAMKLDKPKYAFLCLEDPEFKMKVTNKVMAKIWEANILPQLWLLWKL